MGVSQRKALVKVCCYCGSENLKKFDREKFVSFQPANRIAGLNGTIFPSTSFFKIS